MDAQQPPAIIEIQKTERHDVRQEAIERVARQLCEADGKDCDADIRCSQSGMMTNCLTNFIQFPADRVWYAYRDKAEAVLREAFK